MNCLTDYIGLRGCGNGAPPESGLYVNTLPGISMQAIDAIATAEQITYAGVWADVQEEAWQEFTIEFFDAMMRCYTVQPYCDYESLICENKKLLASTWRYKCAIQLMMFRCFTDRLNYFSLVTRDDAEDLIQLYTGKYTGALKKSMQLIDVRKCHLHCGGDPEVVIWLP